MEPISARESRANDTTVAREERGRGSFNITSVSSIVRREAVLISQSGATAIVDLRLAMRRPIQWGFRPLMLLNSHARDFKQPALRYFRQFDLQTGVISWVSMSNLVGSPTVNKSVHRRPRIIHGISPSSSSSASSSQRAISDGRGRRTGGRGS